jgi:hypothetical protein
MDPANVGKNPPFVPLVHKVTVTGNLPKGTFTSTDGLYAKLYPYAYNGQSQTAVINFKWPKPV